MRFRERISAQSVVLICALIIFLLPFFIFWPVAVGEQIWQGGDFSRYNYPLFAISARQWRQGHIPLWNPYFFGGTPLVATQQASEFYPLNVLMWLTLPTELLIGWSVLLHLGLAGLGVFIFLHSLRLHPLAAFLGGLTFQVGGFAMSHLGHLMILRALPWIGFSLYGYHLWGKTGKGRYLTLISISTAFLALSGHPQVVLYSFLLVTSYLLFGRSRDARSISLALLALALGIGLSTVQLLPGAWMLFTGELSSVDAIGPSFHPAYLLMHLFPRIRDGSYAEMVSYIGFGPFLLVFLSLLQREKEHARTKVFFVVWGFVGLLLSTGRFIPPLFETLSHIPLYGQVSRVPSRHLLELGFSLSILAAFGLDGLIRQARPGRLKFVIPALVVFLTGWGLFAAFTPFNADAPSLIWDPSSYRRVRRPLILFFLNIFLFVAIWRIRRKELRLALVCLLLFIAIWDIVPFGTSIYSAALGSPDFYLNPPPLAGEIDAMSPNTPFRIISVGTVDKRLLAPNFHAVYGFESLAGYDALMVHDFRSSFYAQIHTWGYVEPQAVERPDFRAFLDLFGVRYVLANPDVATALDSYYEPIRSREEGVVYLNPDARERLFPALGVDADPETDHAFGDTLSLANYSLGESLSPDDDVTGYQITTWWRCARQMSEDYTLYIHYVDPSGELVAQDDHLLGRRGGDQAHPTSQWVCPGYYRDVSRIPQELVEAGDIDVALGIWIPATGDRLSFSGELPVDEHGRVQLGSPVDFEGVESDRIITDEYGREWLDPYPAAGQTVRILDYGAGRIEAEVDFDRDGILVHGTTYVSGWKATIDGETTPVFRISDLLQGVYVPEGEHRVVFKYAPDRFRWGTGISAVSLVAILLLGVGLESGGKIVAATRRPLASGTSEE